VTRTGLPERRGDPPNLTGHQYEKKGAADSLIGLQPLALSPMAAARFLSISKRTLSRLIAAGKIVARKDGSRTLVDVTSLKAYYASLPVKAVAPRK
jgi:excisionase family DNA binding protein